MQRRLRNQILGLAAALATATALAVTARSNPLDEAGRGQAPDSIKDTDRTLSPFFVVQGGDPGVDALPLKATSAAIDVSGVIASVVVAQTYVNDGKRPLHARYVFPASTRAAVHGMRMTIGNRVIEAVVAERAEARERFEQAKREGKSASLLEEDRPNVFTMNVANILPGDTIKVELRYTELLVPTDGVYELVYPTVVGPRYSNQPAAGAPAEDQFVASPYTPAGTPPTYSFALDARITSGMPIQDVSVPSHTVQVAWTGKNQARVILDPSERAGGNRDFLLRYRLAGGAIESGLLLQQGKAGATREAERDNFFLLMVEPPARVTAAEIPPREFVFIVDVSGSMHGYPLDTAKKLLRDLVGNLRPTDTFNVILFSGAHQLMAPRSIPATADNIAQATALIDRQSGGGGTELLPALQEAMALPADGGTARSFVVVTDGYIAGERDTFEYIRSHLGSANVFSFGIGSAVNRFLIDGVARAGMGEPFVVTDPSEAPAVATRFKTYIESPVLTDIEISYGGFQVKDVEPASIPDLLARRPIVVRGKWTGTPTGTITIKGVGGSGRFTKVIDVAAAAATPPQPALAHLWARERIALLSDFHEGDETDAEKAEIIRLGLAYNLLTKHTSFLAVLQEVRNQQGGTEVAQPLPLPAGVSDMAVGGDIGVGSEPPLALLAAALALVILAARVRPWWRARAARRG
jgi:Ca-activated chloride channel family protein